MPFISKTLRYSFCAYWKDEIGVFEFVFRCFPHLDPRCPLDSGMSLLTCTACVKGVLGLGGEGLWEPKNTSHI